MNIHDSCLPLTPSGIAVKPPEHRFPDRERVHISYDRYDKYTGQIDHRESGSIRLKNANTKAKTLKKHYREFARIGNDITLGILRSMTGCIGIANIRRAIKDVSMENI